jgi:uncharacterized MAPEG superfamily protein
MSVEMALLVWSTALCGSYIGVQALLYRLQHGFLYSATSRDSEPPPDVMTARGNKALRNFLETYPVFIALAVAIEISGRSEAMTQWGAHVYFWSRWVYLPLYVLGVPYLRSLTWSVAAAGLGLMFLGVVI